MSSLLNGGFGGFSGDGSSKSELLVVEFFGDFCPPVSCSAAVAPCVCAVSAAAACCSVSPSLLGSPPGGVNPDRVLDSCKGGGFPALSANRLLASGSDAGLTGRGVSGRGGLNGFGVGGGGGGLSVLPEVLLCGGGVLFISLTVLIVTDHCYHHCMLLRLYH